MRKSLAIVLLAVWAAFPTTSKALDMQNAYRVVDAIIQERSGKREASDGHDLHDYAVRCILENAPRRRLRQLASADPAGPRFGLVNYVRQAAKRVETDNCVIRRVRGIK